jgi:hypothetical protein
VTRAVGRGTLHGAFLHVRGDDPRAGQRRQDLHRGLTQPTEPDDQRRPAAPGQVGQRELDRVVRREPGIGQGSRIDRVGVAQRDEVPRGHGNVLRHAPVAADAAGEVGHGRHVLAVRVLPARARRAAAAPDRAVDQERVALREAADAGPELLHPARGFVPQRERRLHVRHLTSLEVVVDPDVGMARARARHFEQHFAGTGDRTGDVLEGGERLPVIEADCLHVTPHRGFAGGRS